MTEELNSFVMSLNEDVQLAMDTWQTPAMAFTATILDRIGDMIDYKEPILEHCRLTNAAGNVVGEIHAYTESTNGEVLYLFYTDYNSSTTVKSKSNTDAQVDVNRPQGFYKKAIQCAFSDVDSASSEYKALKYIYDNVQRFHSVNIVVLSNYSINNLKINKITIASKPVYLDVWDLKKIYGNTHSMSDHIAIDIDFDKEEYSRYKIPFIQMESTQYGYKCIQAIFPAKLLYQLYEKYNTNLLYNNVRYFLGLKGAKDKKPNVAMLDTLRKENEMFLAYNNGITALAKDIDSTGIGGKTDITDPENKTEQQYITMGVLKKITDFRIINGGQTTAVIFNAKNISNESADPTKKVNLLGVYVQMKLIISDNIEDMSGNITLSSNFQNKVKYSDFSVGNQFNTTMERLSRAIVVPNPSNEPIHWFYERLRGQYDEKHKQTNTKQDREYFEFQFPKDRKFSKEDIAKVWSNWEQHPYDAVKGASTTYATFMKGVVERGFIPDETYYKKTIALIIVYKFLMSRPDNKKYANGKASVVAYSMAMLQAITVGQFDLDKIWSQQGLSPNTMIYLNTLCEKVFQLLNQRAAALNTSILSYGKTKAAFEYVIGQPFDINIHLLDDDITKNACPHNL